MGEHLEVFVCLFVCCLLRGGCSFYTIRPEKIEIYMRCLHQNSHSTFADIVTYQQQRGYFHLLPFTQNCDIVGLK